MKLLLTKLFGNRGQDGQTLVDLLVAIGLLGAAVTSAGALATVSSRAGAEAGRRSQATALASMEIEAFRTWRDTRGRAAENIFEDFDGSPECDQFIMRETVSGWEPHAVSGLTAYPGYAGAPAELSEFGAFSRVITLCDGREFSHTSNSYQAGKSGDVKDIEVLVQWQEGRGPDRQVILRSILSEWSLN